MFQWRPQSRSLLPQWFLSLHLSQWRRIQSPARQFSRTKGESAIVTQNPMLFIYSMDDSQRYVVTSFSVIAEKPQGYPKAIFPFDEFHSIITHQIASNPVALCGTRNPCCRTFQISSVLAGSLVNEKLKSINRGIKMSGGGSWSRRQKRGKVYGERASHWKWMSKNFPFFFLLPRTNVFQLGGHFWWSSFAKMNDFPVQKQAE